MKLLEELISTKGIIIDDDILKVDSFLNHQVNPVLMQEIGREFKHRFSGAKVTKVITAESSGIAPALMTALEFGVDLVFARKQQSLTLKDELLTANVYSFTKQEYTSLTVSKQHIHDDDVVLLIDDFLANGEVACGLLKVTQDVGAKIAGFGFVIEKSFQKGRSKLEKTGIQIESLARIASLGGGKVKFL